MTENEPSTQDVVVPAPPEADVPISPDHLTEGDRQRSQAEQTATDIAIG